MADDDRSGGSGGFDDWLDEEPGPDTDPYAALSTDDDAESEIAEWMAFTQGEIDGDDDADDDDDPGAASSDDAQSAAARSEEAEPAPHDAPIDAAIETEVTAEIELPVSTNTPDEAHTPDALVTEDVATEDVATSADVATPIEHQDTEEIDVTMLDGDEVDPLDRAARIPIIRPAAGQPATTVDLDEFDGGARADTDEVPIVAGADVVAATVVNLNDRTKGTRDDTGELDGAASDVPEGDAAHGVVASAASALDDDTGELEAVDDDGDDAIAAATFDADAVGDDAALGAFSMDAAGPPPGPDEAVGTSRPELFDLTQENYLAGATRDHADLAAAIAEADAGDTEQVALAAPIAGLESTVVGFDDVVQAEGHGRVKARASGDLLARVITAIVLIGALAASLVWKPALVALATAVFVIGAGEFYTALTRSGRHPIALFGFVGILGATLGAFAWGPIAIPTAFFLVATVLLLFYAVVPGRADPMANLALTVTVMVWVGLGAYAMPIAVSDDYRPLIIGVVVAVAAMDIAQYFVGRGLGRHQLSPWVSPKKTVEGLVGGVIVALGIGALLHFFPPFELTSGLAIGAAVALLAPLGDLAMSAAKRALGIKDMGSILPGHGGFLDRIDGLLFVIPAAWAIFLWAGVL